MKRSVPQFLIRRLWIRASALLLLLLFLNPIPIAVTQTDRPSLELKIAVFEDVWKTINERYYDANFNGVDWKAQHKRYRPLIEQAREQAEFYRLLRQMVGSLRDSHTRVFPPDERFDWRYPRIITVGLSVRKVENRAVVIEVALGSEAEAKGIRPGYIVSQVDGAPVEDLIKSLRRDQSFASTQRSSEARLYSRIFYGKKDTPVRATFIDGLGKRHTITLMRREAQAEPKLSFDRLADGYGYIKFNGFWPETEKAFAGAIGELHNAPGLIIDLRDNGGGAALSAAQMASHLIYGEVSLGKFVSRRGRVIEPRTERINRKYLYNGPVVVLIDERSGSGAEIFAAALQEAGRAQLIGRPSCGCVLGINQKHDLPDGGQLDVSEVDYRTAMGARLEGKGVIPDELVELRVADILAGRDVAMNRAIARLRLAAEPASIRSAQ